MTYKVKVAHNVAEISLDDVVPQPKSTGMQPTRRRYSASGAVIDEGLFVELEFSVLQSAAQYNALLTQFGIKTVTTNPVTVYVRNQFYEMVRMNGTAVQPEQSKDIQWSRYFPRNVTILIKNLEIPS